MDSFDSGFMWQHLKLVVELTQATMQKVTTFIEIPK